MPHLLDDLTDSQREAVTHGDGPLLVVAGAGSGKTRVVTRRVAYLAASGVPAYRILAITFTNKAADEMMHRVAALTGTRGSWISTFHSMCARMLRQFPDLLGFSHPFSIYDRADSLACIKTVLLELGLGGSGARPQSFLGAISRAKNEMRGADEFAAQATSFKDRQIAEVYRAYEHACRANNALDFDDLLLRTARLLEEDELFRTHWQTRFSHLLIDEYQDTNRPQYVIAHVLAERHGNLCATGDPDQSIYAWRGADIRNILDFQRDHPGSRVVKLEENFRSTQTILLAASGVIENNKARIERGLWTHNEAGAPVEVVESASDIDEADAIATAILARAGEGAAYGDVAVFYRTHAQSRVLEGSLRDAGVPYVILDAVEFYNRKEIKDVVAYLKLIVNPADAISVLRVVNEPRRGIGLRTLERLRAFAAARRVSVGEALASAKDIPGLAARTAKQLEAFAALTADLRELPRAPVAALIKAVLAETGYLRKLRESGAEEDTARAENVEELVNAAAEFDLDYPDAGLELFLERVSLVADSDAMTSDRGQVRLMTLHSAKGLEFPAVFIAGVQEGLLPHLNAFGSKSRIEEERRLCYVGMTRAQKRLALHWAAEHFRYGQLGAATASRFLREIPDAAKVERGAEDLEPEPAVGTRVEDLGGGRVVEYDEDAAGGTAEVRPEDVVRHPVFGRGRVLSVSGRGDRRMAVVDFRGRKRHLMLRFADLVRAG